MDVNIEARVAAQKKAKEHERKRRQAISKDFANWVANPTENRFKDYKPLGPLFLIRLYYFDAAKVEKKKSSILLDMDSDRTAAAEMDSQLFPIGKILAVGNDIDKKVYGDLKPGDLVTVKDSVTSSSVNPEWVDYQALLLEKPSMKQRVNEPPQFIGEVVKWRNFVFIEDKFAESPTLQDAYTFLVDQRTILTKYEPV